MFLCVWREGEQKGVVKLEMVDRMDRRTGHKTRHATGIPMKKKKKNNFSCPYRPPTSNESPSRRINLKWSMAESLPVNRCTSSSWFSTTYSLGRTFSCHMCAPSQQHFVSTIRLIMSKWSPPRDLPANLLLVCFLRVRSPNAALDGVSIVLSSSVIAICSSASAGRACTNVDLFFFVCFILYSPTSSKSRSWNISPGQSMANNCSSKSSSFSAFNSSREDLLSCGAPLSRSFSPVFNWILK